MLLTISIMGIADIIYKEFNRYRDEEKSKKEREAIARRMIEKVLYRFIYEWDALKKGLGGLLDYDESDSILVYYSDLVLNVAVEVNDTIDTEIIDFLRKIATQMKKLKACVKGMGENKEYEDGIDEISKNCSLLMQRLKKYRK